MEHASIERDRWKILVVLLVAIFMSLVGVSIVNVALPSIQQGLGASNAEIQWVLSGYALTFGVILVTAGRVGDLYGRGALFIIGVAIFTLASVGSGLAPDPLTLNIARLAQGVGSGLMNPQAIGMIQHYFHGAARARAYGLFGSTVGISVAAGPIFGGLLIAASSFEVGWRWTFFVNVPVGVVAIILGYLWFPRPLLTRNRSQTRDGAERQCLPGPPEAATQSRDLDPVGSLLLGLAVLAVLLPFVESRENPWFWLLLPIGVALTWAWLTWERRYVRRGHSPMVDLSIFRTKSFANGTLLITLYFFGVTSVWVLIALYMQDGLGHTALASGLVGLPGALLTVVTANWAGRRVMRSGRKVVIAGMLSVLAGLASSILVIQLHATSAVSEWWLLLTLAFIGGGQGSVISPNQTLTLEEVPLRYAGSSGGVMQTGQRIGTSIGISIITSLAFIVLARSNWTTAMTVGFLAVAVVVLVAMSIAVYDLQIRKQDEHPRSA